MAEDTLFEEVAFDLGLECEEAKICVWLSGCMQGGHNKRKVPEEKVFRLFKEQKEGLGRRNILNEEREVDGEVQEVPETR